MIGDGTEPHPWDGLRWVIARALLVAAALPALAGLVGLHYLP